MPNLIAVFDACILYPAPLRDLLMHLALTDLFHAGWTENIHEEWTRNLLKNRPDLKRLKLEQTRNLMNQNVRDCLVTGYQSLIQKLLLPDLSDRHVLAAAITAQADIIVTFSLSDFPAATLKPFGIQAQHPDDFIAELLDFAPDTVLFAIQQQRLSLRNPPVTLQSLLETLHRQGLVKTTAFLQNFAPLV